MNRAKWHRRHALSGMAVGLGTALIGFATWRAAHAQAVREISMIAQRFKFVPNVIELKMGEPVLLRISSLDYVHGFNVPDMGIRADLLPRQITDIRITPTQAGRVDFLCDNFCGDNHEEMHGYFNVLE